MRETKQYGKKKYVDNFLASANVLIHGYIEEQTYSPYIKVGISANGRIELSRADWEELKSKVDTMFSEVDTARGTYRPYHPTKD